MVRWGLPEEIVFTYLAVLVKVMDPQEACDRLQELQRRYHAMTVMMLELAVQDIMVFCQRIRFQGEFSVNGFRRACYAGKVNVWIDPQISQA